MKTSSSLRRSLYIYMLAIVFTILGYGWRMYHEHTSGRSFSEHQVVRPAELYNPIDWAETYEPSYIDGITDYVNRLNH